MSTAAETARWRALDAAHYLHPFTDHKSLADRGTMGSVILIALRLMSQTIKT